jgi:poly(hydroxyalkanoate) depolymerase family esterase
MSPGREDGIQEATCLVRAGRVTEATALIQRLLGPMSRSVSAAEERPWRMSDHRRNWIRRAAQVMRGRSAPTSTPEPDFISEPGQFLTRSYENSAGRRAYRLYIPSGYRGQPVPLVVMLHGCKQTAEDFAAGTRMNVHAEGHSCLVAYPAQSSNANGSKCWNWFSPEHQTRGNGEASLIAGITQKVVEDFTVDLQRIYVAELSAGGAAAAIMGAAYPDLYAAVGVHSGLACGAAHDVPSAFNAMRLGEPSARGAIEPGPRLTRPTIVFHGDRDSTVNPRNSEQVLAQAATGRVLEKLVERGQVPGGHAYTRILYSERNGAVILESWTVHGAGHAWSGGNPAGSYTDPYGPDAGREMLRFFLEHSHAKRTALSLVSSGTGAP